MKNNKIGFVFITMVVLIILILGIMIGMKVNDDIEQNGLCWSPSITTNGEETEYEVCIIQPPQIENYGD